MRSRFYIQRFAWGLLVVLSTGCRLVAWMHWSCIDEFVLGFISVEELYPSSPLGVDTDSADTSQLPKEKNLHGQFKYFQITQPGSSTVSTASKLLYAQGQHWIRLEMQPDVAVQSLRMLVDPADATYMPALVVVLGGDNLASLKGTMLRERIFLFIDKDL
jgi:hypothetical protein